MPGQNNQTRDVLVLNRPSGDKNIHLIPGLPSSLTFIWQNMSEYLLCSRAVFKDLRVSAVWRQKARQGWPRIITSVQPRARKRSLNKGCVCLSAFIRFELTHYHYLTEIRQTKSSFKCPVMEMVLTRRKLMISFTEKRKFHGELKYQARAPSCVYVMTSHLSRITVEWRYLI